MTSTNTLHVLIADDHQLFLDGLRMLLSTTDQFDVVVEANNGRQALEAMSGTKVDLAVLDINMPELDGIDTAKSIRDNYPNVRILMLTMYNHDTFIKRLMRAGVDGYILKENSQKELLAALETIASGKKYFAPEVTQAVMDSFNPSIKKTGLDKVSLTKREMEVLQLVTQELTAQEIADRLFVSQSTVITHRKNIMRKLDARNTAGMVRIATELGWVS